MSPLLYAWATLARGWLCFADDRRAVKWNHGPFTRASRPRIGLV